MTCPYLRKCKEKVTKSYYESFCKCNYWECYKYEELSEKEEITKTPAEWENSQ